MNTKLLLYAGYISPFIFWVTTIICGSMLDNYNHLTYQVSELGIIGLKTQYIFTTGLVLCSVFSIPFIWGLIQSCRMTRQNIVPVIVLYTFTFSVCAAAIFPLPLYWHGILGLPSMLLPLSPLLSLILWKNDKIPNIKLFSLLALLIMMLGFLILLPDVLGDYVGLKQRFFHIGWTFWFIYLSYIFTRINRKSTLGNEPLLSNS
jgi:hypothetical membrane protein